MSYLHIYKASAGAGKTHVLVEAYLQLALQNPEEFSSILSITFTNRAAEEMKNRILHTIHAMAEGKSIPLGKTICQQFGWDISTLQARATLLQSYILHQYDRLGIGTIDSFLQTVLRNFAREMGLPYNFKIELNQEKVLDALIDMLIGDVTKDVQLRKFLVDFAEYNLQAGRSWNFKKSLKQLGNELFSEQFAEHQSSLLAALQVPGQLPSFLDQIKQIIDHFEQSLQQKGRQTLSVIQQAGLTVSNFSYGERGVAGYLAGLATKKGFRPTKRSLQALDTVEAWYSKSSPHKHTIEPLVKTKLQNILQDCLAYYQTHYQTYYTARSIQTVTYAFGIAAHLVKALARIRSEQNLLFISDITYLLHRLIQDTETPFIYEKVGSFYKHFLIDEFQDISMLQWKNLKPLLENGIASGGMSLVVGDVKQAIYRWRDSDWQLLATQVEKDVVTKKTIDLVYNWRSKPAIVRFNNTFFTQAHQHLLHHLETEIATVDSPEIKEKLTQLLENVHAVYGNAYQKLPTDYLTYSEPGYVEISFIDTNNVPPDYISWKETVKTYIPTLVENLQKQGIKPHEAAFLVRNRNEVKEICQLLLAYQDSQPKESPYSYTAFSSDLLYIEQTVWINILISALTYLINPNLTANTIELIYLYQQHVPNPVPISKHALFGGSLSAEWDNLLPSNFLNNAIQYAYLPLYECVEKLIACFQLHITAAAPFIETFQEIVLTYLHQHPSDIEAFLAWWQAESHQQALSYTQTDHAWNVLTIHQAKGLEFKATIIPFCAWPFDHPAQKGPLMWRSTSVTPFSMFPILPIPYTKNLQETHYVQAYYEEKIQAYIDHFNLLYVAFTRAEEALYILAPRPMEYACSTTADLLYQTLTNDPIDGVNNPIESQAELFLHWADHWDAVNQRLSIGKPIYHTQA